MLQTLDHKFSVPIIFINSKIKAIWIAKIDFIMFIVCRLVEVVQLCVFGTERVYCVEMVYSQFIVEPDLSTEMVAFNSFENGKKSRSWKVTAEICGVISVQIDLDSNGLLVYYAIRCQKIQCYIEGEHVQARRFSGYEFSCSYDGKTSSNLKFRNPILNPQTFSPLRGEKS